jgi:cytochrome c5
MNRLNRRVFLVVTLVLLGSAQSLFAADGKALYETTCVACHGAMAQGAIPGVPDLSKNGSLAKSDAELTASILNGFKSKESPLAMPPK